MPDRASITASPAAPAALPQAAGMGLTAGLAAGLAIPRGPAEQAEFAAVAAARGVPPLIRHHWTFPAVPEQVRHARHALAGVLTACPFAQDVVLCLSELAANAVLHSNSGQPDGTFWVRAEIRADQSLLLEVGDSGGCWQPAAEPDDRMHGLGIVEALAGQVTVTGDAAGRVVQVRFTCPEAGQ